MLATGGDTLTAERGTWWVQLPAPPARLSHDSNILSRNVTDGAGRLRYIPPTRVEQGLACLGALALHVAERIVVLGGVARGTARTADSAAVYGDIS